MGGTGGSHKKCIELHRCGRCNVRAKDLAVASDVQVADEALRTAHCRAQVETDVHAVTTYNRSSQWG